MKLNKLGFILILLFISQIAMAQDISIMTYNIRLDVASDAENAWPNRKEMLANQILFHSPDVLGVQEAKPNQMDELNNALKGYASFGLGRDGEQKGEHSSIFYNKERLEVIEKGTFWLSQSPSEVSKGWDASLPRICTYGLFSIKNLSKQFWVFNTHLDHIGVEARKNSLNLILKKIEEVNKDNLPVVLMGDFNLEPSDPIMINIFTKMTDAKELADVIHGPTATFTAFDTTKAPERRIDYILLLNHENLNIISHAILAEMLDQRYPSDHFPVMVKLKFK